MLFSYIQKRIYLNDSSILFKDLFPHSISRLYANLYQPCFALL
jgi:hypothetical protein